MATLVQSQQSLLDLVLREAFNSSDYPGSVLLIGQRGTAKATIAREAASRLGCDFVPVPLADTADSISQRLFGTIAEAERAMRDGQPPGELGRTDPAVIYLVNLENAPTNVLQSLHRCITTRRYTDAMGHTWSVNDLHFIVGALVMPASPCTVASDHWICTAFDARFTLTVSADPAEVLQVAANIARQNTISMTGDALAVLVSEASDGLHALRRWLAAAARDTVINAHITADLVSRAVVADAQHSLTQLVYRGQILTYQYYQRWCDQFPHELRPVAAHIVSKIAERYYISQRRYHEALSRLIKLSGIPPGSYVSFCTWQEMGKSGPRVAQELKNQAGWRISKDDVDLRMVDGLSLSTDQRWFIIADDFVGSGRTLRALWDSPSAPVPRLLRRYPQAQIRVLMVSGFESGIKENISLLAPYRDRVSMVTEIIFRDEDRCFSPSSRIILNSRTRDALLDFCTASAKTHYPRLSRAFCYGYEEMAALVVFFDTVPNNSLPMLWHSSKNWMALFPAAGMPIVEI